MPEYGSDLIVDLLKTFEVEYAALNPGATFRGLHDSIVNYGGNRLPEIILCCHEEIAVAVAHGYGKVKGRPSAEAITLFESQGIGIEDIAASAYVLQKAKEQGIGVELPF